MDSRIINERKHGEFLAKEGAGEIWNWTSPAGKVRWDRRVKMLTSSIKKNEKILELGCGTGYFTKEIVKTEAAITAIDISPDLLRIAAKEVVANNVSFCEENAYNTTFAANSFDRIIGSSVLHHLEIELAVKEMFRILKPGGTIAFTEPNMVNPQIALQKNIPWLKRKLGDSPDETAFFRWKLKKILNENGFRDIALIPFDFLHPAIPKSMIPMISKIGFLIEKTPLLKEIAGSLYIVARK